MADGHIQQRVFRRLGFAITLQVRGEFKRTFQLMQVVNHRADCGVTLLAAFLQSALHDVLKVCGQAADVRVEGTRLVFENSGDHIAGRLALKRQTARQHFIKHDAEAEHIGARIHFQPARLFGRHIRHRTHHQPRACMKGREQLFVWIIYRFFGYFAFSQFGEAEIQHFDVAIAALHQVLRFDVAVDDACAVGGFERLADLHDDIEYRAQCQVAILEQRAQRLAFDVFGRDEINFARAVYFINRENVRMVERRGGAGFVLKAAHAFGVAREIGAQDFQRHQAPQPRVARQINFAHAAFADLALNFVRAYALSGCQFCG